MGKVHMTRLFIKGSYFNYDDEQKVFLIWTVLLLMIKDSEIVTYFENLIKICCWYGQNRIDINGQKGMICVFYFTTYFKW